MGEWKKWAIVVGGLAAIVSDFWAAADSFYLATIGGAVAVVVALMQN